MIIVHTENNHSYINLLEEIHIKDQKNNVLLYKLFPLVDS